MRFLFIFIMGVLMSLGSLAADTPKQLIPQCFAGFCVKNPPTEKAVRNRFGGSGRHVFYDALGYCYRFTVGKEEVSYGYFLFKYFGDGERLVTIISSKEPICPNAHNVNIRSPLLTEKGIGLDSTEAEILTRYGQPRYLLRPPPAEVVRGFFGGPSKKVIDTIIQYVPSDDRELLSARFFISEGKVVGIEISADE